MLTGTGVVYHGPKDQAGRTPLASKEDWIGRTGKEWARRDEALEKLLGPVADEGITHMALQPGQHILDLGCGAGASTEALANRVGPKGHVTGIDISPDLMALARARLGDHPNVDLIEDDAATHRYAVPYDGLFSRFGSMFFDDPPVAFTHLHGALKPGATATFLAWQEPGRNQWASVPMTFIAPSGAATAPKPGPGPFAWADPDVFRPLLSDAGFQSVTHVPFEFMAEIASGDDPDPLVRAVTFMSRIGPLASRLAGADEQTKREAAAFLERRLARHMHDGAVRLLASAWIISAKA